MTTVSLLRSAVQCYPPPPFHPTAGFPELARAGIREISADNGVYSAVRDMFLLLHLDAEHIGTPDWNPLHAYIRPGDKVVIKPNLVLHEFGAQKNANCLTTHGSVIRAVLDYVFLAAGPGASIAIADAPLQGADFAQVVAAAGLPQIQEFYRTNLKCEVRVIDLRKVHAVIDESSSLVRNVEPLPGDPQGYCEIDLGSASRLHEVDAAYPRYIVGDYDARLTNARHRSPQHSYVVSGSVLDADAVICLPKLKTHCKTGLTVCLKNIIGIVGSKDCLPHHRYGKSDQGGDEFAADYPVRWLWSSRARDALQGRVSVPVWRLMRLLARTLLGAGTPQNGSGRHSDFYPSGGWHGNDTIWRTVDDLNRILFFYNRTLGAIQSRPQRRYFAVVDGIVAMEGNGPLRGTPKPAGVVMGGDDPLALDIVAASLMGYDWRRIRLLDGVANSADERRYSAPVGDPSSIRVLSNVPGWTSVESLIQHNLEFHPPSGWREILETHHVE